VFYSENDSVLCRSTLLKFGFPNEFNRKLCMWNQSLIPALIACCKQQLMHTVNSRQTALSLKHTARFDDLEGRVELYN
jgi:hypothetical protein